MDKVVSIYSANELRNKSLFKFLSEDIVTQTETLQQELATEEELARQLETEQRDRDAADAAASARAMDSTDSDVHLVHQLEKASHGVDEILPLVEKLGLTVMDFAGKSLPQHMEGKALGPPTVSPFLALLEDAFHEMEGKAKAVRRPTRMSRRTPLRMASRQPPTRALRCCCPPPLRSLPSLWVSAEHESRACALCRRSLSKHARRQCPRRRRRRRSLRRPRRRSCRTALQFCALRRSLALWRWRRTPPRCCKMTRRSGCFRWVDQR